MRAHILAIRRQPKFYRSIKRNKLEIEDLIELLERELGGRRGIVNDKVDLAECRRLLGLIREKLIPITDSVNGVVAQRNAILTNADAVAKNLLAAAEQKAASMVGSSEVVRKAQAESRRILDETYDKCDKLVLKTKQNLDEMLLAAERKLECALRQVGDYRYGVKSMVINSSVKQSD